MPQHAPPAPNTPAGVTPTAPWRVDQVTVLSGFRLRVRFLDGLEGEVDCSALVQSEAAGVFAPLREEKLFAQAYVSLGVVTWPQGQDLAPDAMHDTIARHGFWRPEPC